MALSGLLWLPQVTLTVVIMAVEVGWRVGWCAIDSGGDSLSRQMWFYVRDWLIG